MQTFYKISIALIIVGGLNWGLVGLFGFNLVAWLCGSATGWLTRTVYVLVGIAALCAVPSLFGTVSDQP